MDQSALRFNSRLTEEQDRAQIYHGDTRHGPIRLLLSGEPDWNELGPSKFKTSHGLSG
jgi:hypothetical protein